MKRDECRQKTKGSFVQPAVKNFSNPLVEVKRNYKKALSLVRSYRLYLIFSSFLALLAPFSQATG